MHRHVDPWIAASEGLQGTGQEVACERRHGRDGHASHLQGETLAQQFFGIVPVSHQLACQRQQRLALGRQADIARGSRKQLTAKVFLQTFDRQAQGRLGQVQPLACLGKTQVLRHGQESAKLLHVHIFIFLINRSEKQN